MYARDTNTQTKHTTPTYVDERTDRRTSPMEMPNHFGDIEMAFEFGFNRIAPFEFRAFDWLLYYYLFIEWASERTNERVWLFVWFSNEICCTFKVFVLHTQTHTRFVHSIHYAAPHRHTHTHLVLTDELTGWLAGCLVYWLTDWFDCLLNSHTHVLYGVRRNQFPIDTISVLRIVFSFTPVVSMLSIQ